MPLIKIDIGMSQRYLLRFCELSNLTMISPAKNMSRAVAAVMTSTKKRLSPRRFAASSWDSGSMMECSYRRQATTPIIPAMEKKSAATPKASGAKSLVRMGIKSIPRPWATALPVVSFRTLEAKLDDGFDNLSNTLIML